MAQRPSTRPGDRPGNRPGDRNTNIRNTNIRNTNIRNTNVNVNRNVNIHSYGGWNGGWCCNSYMSPGAFFAITAGTAITAATIASMTTGPNAACTMSSAVVNGETFYRCGSAWYQKTYDGSDVAYVVVGAPPGY